MQIQLRKNYLYSFLLLACCTCYFIFEFIYNNYVVLAADEFWFAERIHYFKDHLPYRDFSPYKTVLGYYMLRLSPLNWMHGILKPLLATKTFIAGINTLMLFLISLWAKKFFHPLALLLSFLLIFFSEFFLSNSTNIRVDIFAYWFCLIGVLFLFENKFLTAGIFLAFGFLCSQKALWYLGATNLTYAASLLFLANPSKSSKAMLYVNAGFILTTLLYILTWSIVSNPVVVLKSVFYEGYLLATLDWYDAARKFFWSITLSNNPLPFLLFPIFLFSLSFYPTQDTHVGQRWFIFIFSSIILISLITFKQIFPYNFLAAFPALFVFYAAFFTWMLKLIEINSIKFLHPEYLIWFLIGCFYIGIVSSIFYFNLPIIYLSLGIIPFFLVAINPTMYKEGFNLSIKICLLLIIFMTVVFTLSRMTIILKNKDGSYQKNTLKLAELFLDKDSGYIAGIPYVFEHPQAIKGITHLTGPVIDFIFHQNTKLQKYMLSSLGQSPLVSQQVILDELSQHNVKFYLNNYLMHALPPNIKHYLYQNYQHFWGSLYLYAPMILAGKQSFNIKFSGQYTIESDCDIEINHSRLKPSSTVVLKKGNYESISPNNFRLKLVPIVLVHLLNQKYLSDRWEKMSE